MARVEVLEDEAALAEAGARAAIAGIGAAVDAYDTCTWVLAGGGTPMAAYRLLTRHDLRHGVEWDRVRIAIGDERCVPPSHPDSNWGQAAAALLDHVPVPDEHRLRIRGEAPPGPAANEYEALLRILPAARPGVPRLELVWLGVGPDGHTLSLFPGRPDLDERERLVVPVRDAPKPPPCRVTLTLAALAGVERLTVIAGGEAKAAVIAKALAGDDSLPVSRAVAAVEQGGGEVTWLLDRASAGG